MVTEADRERFMQPRPKAAQLERRTFRTIAAAGWDVMLERVVAAGCSNPTYRLHSSV